MSKDGKPAGPLGGWFGTIGGFAGFGLAASMGKNLDALPLLILMIVFGVIGGFVGLLVEHIVVRILIIAAAIIVILLRQQIFHAIANAFMSG